MSMITRRSFLYTGAAAATLAASSAHAKEPAANDKVNVAIIGCRNRGHQVASDMLRSRDFEVVGLCDCDSAMIGEGMDALKGKLKNTPTIDSDFRKTLERADVDAVVIATPDHWHGAMTVLALDAGKHVYLEKPASHNIKDGLAMVAAQEAHPDRVVQVGTQQRSGQHFQDCRQFIQEGGLGKVGFARAWISHDRGVLPIVPDSAPPETLDYNMWQGPARERPFNENRVHYNWRFIRDYGTGEMGNWGAHWLDIVHWYLGIDYPQAAAAHGGQFVTKDAKEWPDTQTVIYEYADTTVLWELRLWTKHDVQGMGGGCEFGGEKGTVLINRGGWTFYPKDGDKVEHGGSEQGVAHARNFAAAVRGEAKPVAPIQEGHKSAVLCHLGNIGATLDRRIAWDPKTGDFGDDTEANAHLGHDYRKPWTREA